MLVIRRRQDEGIVLVDEANVVVGMMRHTGPDIKHVLAFADKIKVVRAELFPRGFEICIGAVVPLSMIAPPAWIPCPCCDEFQCTIHGKHVADCPCPPIEKWKTDPYTHGGVVPRACDGAENKKARRSTRG